MAAHLALRSPVPLLRSLFPRLGLNLADGLELLLRVAPGVDRRAGFPKVRHLFGAGGEFLWVEHSFSKLLDTQHAGAIGIIQFEHFIRLALVDRHPGRLTALVKLFFGDGAHPVLIEDLKGPFEARATLLEPALKG